MKRVFVFALALLLFLIALSVTAASAESPQPYTYALVKCSGLSLSELQSANQKFDTDYGWDHRLPEGNTPAGKAAWEGTYEARVNEFAASLGCPKVLDSGGLTFWYRIYVPVYGWYLGNYPAPN